MKGQKDGADRGSSSSKANAETADKSNASPARRNSGQLAYSLKKQAQLESELESAKAQLAQNPDFNLFDAFSMFDPKRTASVDQYDLSSGLRQIGIHLDYDALKLFISRYDKNGNGKLSFVEF